MVMDPTLPRIKVRDLLMQAVAPRGGRELLSGAYDPVTLEELSGAFSSAQLLANLQSIQQTLGGVVPDPALPAGAVRRCADAVRTHGQARTDRIQRGDPRAARICARAEGDA